MPTVVTPEQIPQVLQVAEQAAQRGNFVLADGMLRDCLDQGLAHPGLHHLLARIGAAMHAFGPAAAHLRAVQKLLPAPDPGIAGTIAELERQEAAQLAARTGSPRFMLIRAWGCGFCSDVDHVLGCLLLAEATGRTPVVRWGQESLFRDEGVANAWTQFFEPVSPVTYEDLPLDNIWPPKWTPATLDLGRVNRDQGEWSRMQYLSYFARTEPLVVMDFTCRVVSVLPWLPTAHPLRGKTPAQAMRALAKKYLRPVPEVAAAADAFYEKHLAPGPAIAAHIRGSDKADEDEALDEGNQALRTGLVALAHKHAASKVFLLTDSTSELAALRAELGDRVVTTDAIRTGGRTGVHFLPNADRTRVGREVMIDMYIAAKCNALIGPGNSNVSCMIEHLKDWPANSIKFQMPSFHFNRNYFGYTW
ncbi:MAG: hypothetical protein WC718_04170 [Phycisphaerales bacterium]|jgi:hypothetical protein